MKNSVLPFNRFIRAIAPDDLLCFLLIWHLVLAVAIATRLLHQLSLSMLLLLLESVLRPSPLLLLPIQWTKMFRLRPQSLHSRTKLFGLTIPKSESPDLVWRESARGNFAGCYSKASIPHGRKTC
jgi:hypothetical protein